MRAEALINRPIARSTKLSGVKSKVSRDFLIVMLLTLVHIPLGVGLYSGGSAAILHPALVFSLGLFLALRKKVNTGHVTLVVAYIVGAEVLWRMAGVPTPWEFGKYASAAILFVALVRTKRFNFPKLPLLYFVCLLPACVLTILQLDLSRVTPTLSFNISGPLLLMVSCWFFYNVRISPAQFQRLLFAIILPLISVAISALFYTVTAEELNFNGESNFTTSGGFGPNQVSGMLGLGAFLSVAGLMLLKRRPGVKIYFTISALLFSALSVMTFSRGGMYNAVGAITILLLFGLQDVAAGLKKIFPAIVLAGFFLFFIYPMLNDFTGGALQERFEDTGTTQRSEIASSDIDIFLENPVFGVGVGSAYTYREKFFLNKAASHTEFSRMLSEHGGFGLAALACMLAMMVANITRANSKPGKAFVAGIMVWTAMFMMNTGMRLAAPGFIWGLSFITIVTLRQPSPTKSRRTITPQIQT